MRVLQNVLPDFLVLFSSLYLFVMMRKGNVFPPESHQKDSAALRRRAKQLYLQRHFQTTNQHSLFNYALLISFFFAGSFLFFCFFCCLFHWLCNWSIFNGFRKLFLPFYRKMLAYFSIIFMSSYYYDLFVSISFDFWSYFGD